MDAQESKRRSGRFGQPWVVRLVAIGVAAVLAIGLWQGYGAWLLGDSHGG